MESLVADINRLVDEGVVARDELEVALTADDLGILESKIQPASWYALDSFARFTQLLLEREGGGDVEYLRERGRRAARRIGESGLYTQLSSDVVETYGERVGKVMVTVGPALFRDTEWKHEYLRSDGGGEPVGSRILMKSPVLFPDVCRHAVQGFVEHMTSVVVDTPYVYRSERPSEHTLLIEGRRAQR